MFAYSSMYALLRLGCTLCFDGLGAASTAKMPILGGPQLAATATSAGDSRFPAALPAQQEPPSQEARSQGPACCRQAGPKLLVSPP